MIRHETEPGRQGQSPSAVERRQRTRMLTLTELAHMARAEPRLIRTLTSRGWFRGQVRGAKFRPLALPIIEALIELGALVNTGALTPAEARGVADYIRPVEIERIWGLALMGKPFAAVLTLQSADGATKTVELRNIARAAQTFAQFVNAA